MLSWLLVSDGERRFHHHAWRTLRIQAGVCSRDSKFEASVMDAIKIATIFTDHTLRFLGVKVPQTTIVIDPDQFYIETREIPLSRLTKEEADRWIKQGALESLIPEGTKIKRLTKSITDPGIKRDIIGVLPDGKVVFHPESGQRPQLRIVK